MGIIEDEHAIYFAGSSKPLAFLELKRLGLPAEATKDLSRDLCSLVHEELSITPEANLCEVPQRKPGNAVLESGHFLKHCPAG